MTEYILELHEITKSFPGVLAVDNLSFSIEKGTVHGIIGENGAGKSTLIKIISGAQSMDSGTITFDGSRVEIKNAADAMNLGIGTVYQEMSLVPALNAVENIFLGNELMHGITLDYKAMHQKTQNALDKLNVSIDLTIPIQFLSTAQQQMIEIARSLVFQRKLIIMDEPTSSLAQKDVQELFSMIRLLKESGVTIIYISHKLEELEEISDNLTILRDGKFIETVKFSEVDVAYVIAKMVGRELGAFTHLVSREVSHDIALSVTGLSDNQDFVQDATFELPKGIILGFAGLVGAGRTELMKMIFGANPIAKGSLVINGVPISTRGHTTKKAVANGIAYLSEDRKHEGLALSLPVKQNISISNLSAISNGFILDLRLEHKQTESCGCAVKISMANIQKKASALSGGNQQKVAIAKWLFTNCDIFIFDEPTRGIDIGARSEIYNLMNHLVDSGKSIILVSSDLNEILALSNQVITMSDGRIIGKLDNDGSLTQNQIMKQMLGGYIDG